MSEPEEPEVMRYGMVGDDVMSDAEKLEKYSGDVTWDYVRPHFEKGVVLWIDLSLDLQEVGKAIAADDKKSVQAWQKTGDLIVPSDPHDDHWTKIEARFNAVVVQPFIVIQDLPESEDSASENE